MDEATFNIGIFQDAVGLDMATDDENKKLTE